MIDPVLYLSEQWVEAANDALAAVRVEQGPAWSVCYIVNGGPTGSSAHELVFDDERVSVRGGSVDPSVTLTLDWELAVAINQGSVSAQGAFLDGRIQLSGDPGVLLGRRHQLTTADEQLARLRDRTVYGPTSIL